MTCGDAQMAPWGRVTTRPQAPPGGGLWSQSPRTVKSKKRAGPSSWIADKIVLWPAVVVERLGNAAVGGGEGDPVRPFKFVADVAPDVAGRVFD